MLELEHEILILLQDLCFSAFNWIGLLICFFVFLNWNRTSRPRRSRTNRPNQPKKFVIHSNGRNQNTRKQTTKVRRRITTHIAISHDSTQNTMVARLVSYLKLIITLKRKKEAYVSISVNFSVGTRPLNGRVA